MACIVRVGDEEFMANIKALQSILRKAKSIVALTGAGTSAESGVPTFRGAGGLWRSYKSTDLATPEAFRRDPVLVWQFYHYRRELVNTKIPNPAHHSLAQLESWCKENSKEFTLITQNVDGLHQRAGSRIVLELHGNLFKVRCTKCKKVTINNDSPICAGLAAKTTTIAELPHCSECGNLLRPHIVWFGENLEPDVLRNAEGALAKCECCLVIGTSSVVYPAAMFAPQLAQRGVPVAEFNIESTPETANFQYMFEGPAGEVLPTVIDLKALNE